MSDNTSTRLGLRRVVQTVLATPRGGVYEPGNTGNCQQAALASALDMDLDDVPHFVDYPVGYDPDADPLVEEHGALWYRACRRWLRAGNAPHGRPLDLMGQDPGEVARWLGHPSNDDAWPLHALASVQSPRGDFTHAVVLDRHGHIAWDPHPAQNAYGLEVIAEEIICAPYDPAPPDPDPWAEDLIAASV